MNLTVAEISLSALRHNLLEVVRHVGSRIIMAVVKANAYGHGAPHVSRVLLEAGAHRLGVATVAEAVSLRDAGITAPILVLAGVLPEELPALREYELTPVLPDRETVAQLADLDRRRPTPFPVHLKIDTGMGRLGLFPEQARSLLKDWPSGLRLEGVMSHLASADAGDPHTTELQLSRFRELLEGLPSANTTAPIAHIAGTAGILRYPASHFDMVRPGLMLYGYTTPHVPAETLRAALTWKTRVVQVKRVPRGQAISYGGTFIASRPSTVAVLSVGYADGYSRALSNRGRVLIKGRGAPVVGRICMDLTMVDVTDLPPVQIGDEAILLGQQGDERITADDLAAELGTISYEVLSRIGPRVARVYKED